MTYSSKEAKIEASDDSLLDQYGLGGQEFTVQETAALTGLSEHTLRYYERIGLITPVRRQGSSRHRRYSGVDVARIEALACLRAVGMPIEDMRRYGKLSFEDPENAPELRRLLEQQSVVLTDRRKQIQKTIGYVKMKIAFLTALREGDKTKMDETMKQLQAMTKQSSKRAGEFQ